MLFGYVAYGGKNLFIPIKREVKEPTYSILFFADEAFETNKFKPLFQKDTSTRWKLKPYMM